MDEIFFKSCFARPMASAPLGTFLVRVDPAPTVTSDPRQIGATRTELAPVLLPFPMRV